MLCRHLSLQKTGGSAIQTLKAQLKFSLLYFSQIGIACELSRTRVGWEPRWLAKRKDRALYCKPLPLLVPLVMSHIANMWALTSWKWTPERRKVDRVVLRTNCPWQVMALPSVWFAHSSPSLYYCSSSQIFVLSQIFSICAGIFSVVFENRWRWRET